MSLADVNGRAHAHHVPTPRAPPPVGRRELGVVLEGAPRPGFLPEPALQERTFMLSPDALTSQTIAGWPAGCRAGAGEGEQL